MTDRTSALLKRAKKGDRRAFDLLIAPIYPKIFAHCLYRCKDASMAEDCTQEVLLKAWKGLAKFRGDSSIQHWIRVITNNVINTSYRQQPNWIQVDDMEPFMEPDNQSPEVDIDLQKAMSKLPKGARRVFNLYSIFGFAHHEIAAISGTAEGTSKAQLFRARKLLSAMFS